MRQAVGPWFTIVSTSATVAAAVLAWLAIRNGNKQAKASADALIRERRIDFELDQLDSILQALDLGPNSGMGKDIVRALHLLPPDGLGRLRAVYLREDNEEVAAQRRKAGSINHLGVDYEDWPTLSQKMSKEARDQIAQRLAARD